jgi:RNA polymerase sigma-70 factor (ECF subfamily)
MRVLVNLRERRFRGDSELRTYVHRIARNAAIDAWRRSAAWTRVGGNVAEETADSAPVEQERFAVRELLGKILRRLTREDRRLLSLVFVEHLSYAEVAKRLGIHEGAVKVRVFRCRERMSEERRRLMGIDR